MPSNTLLPTPLPANRPMRWPRPTVSTELIERTPTSSGSLIGWRASGLIGEPVSLIALFAMERTHAIERPTAAIDDTAEQLRSDGRGALRRVAESRVRSA